MTFSTPGNTLEVSPSFYTDFVTYPWTYMMLEDPWMTLLLSPYSSAKSRTTSTSTLWTPTLTIHIKVLKNVHKSFWINMKDLQQKKDPPHPPDGLIIPNNKGKELRGNPSPKDRYVHKETYKLFLKDWKLPSDKWNSLTSIQHTALC